MRRRTFAAGALALAAAPGAARAQTPGRTYRIAVWNIGRPVAELGPEGAPIYRAFFAELRRLGFVEGRNLVVQRYGSEGRTATYESTAREIVDAGRDAIVPNGIIPARLLLALTTTIPVVVPSTSDPIASGLVSSLARPAGIVTGFSLDGGNELDGLKLQLLREALPGASRFAWLTTHLLAISRSLDHLRQAADRLKVELVVQAMPGPFDEPSYRAMFADLLRQSVHAFVVGGSAEHLANAKLIVDGAFATRLPALYPGREFADAGGLMVYGANLADNYRKAAGYVARILNGEKAGDLPFQQPTVFDFVVNLKTAKALGITLPESIMIRATEVIE
jgi:putative tryptophan/tyrosine transport system substrate-binding protein